MNGAGTITAVIGITNGPQQQALFRWLNMQTSAGDSAEFAPTNGGARFNNLRGTVGSYELQLAFVDEAAEQVGDYRYGPFTIPAGASHTLAVLEGSDGGQIRSAIDAAFSVWLPLLMHSR